MKQIPPLNSCKPAKDLFGLLPTQIYKKAHLYLCIIAHNFKFEKTFFEKIDIFLTIFIKSLKSNVFVKKLELFASKLLYRRDKPPRLSAGKDEI